MSYASTQSSFEMFYIWKKGRCFPLCIAHLIKYSSDWIYAVFKTNIDDVKEGECPVSKVGGQRMHEITSSKTRSSWEILNTGIGGIDRLAQHQFLSAGLW